MGHPTFRTVKESKVTMGKILGIDLGTTNSAMAVLEGDEATIIANAEGDHTTPSVVAWKDGERIVGKAALNQQVMNVKNTVYSVKRFIGRTYDELTDADLDGLTYTVKSGPKGRPVVVLDDPQVRDKEILPEAVSAAVLSKMKADAEAYLGEEVTEAIITVPAYFNDTQRQATKDAGEIAGLNVQRIINEPTAAALAYGFGGKNAMEEKTILVFDFGGGTLDVSILDIGPDLVQVVSTAGDNHLGGDDVDAVFTEYLCDRFQNENGVDLREDPMIHSRVREAARKAKEDLSNASSVNVNLPFITAGPSGPLHMNYDVTRDEFNDIIGELIERCKLPISDALKGSPSNPIDMQMSDIDNIILVGGSTRIPAIQKMVEQVCGKKPEKTVNPDEVVAMGAAIQGGVLEGSVGDILLADVNSMTLGIKTYPDDVSVMIPKNTPIPAAETKIFTTREDNQDNVEVVVIQGEAPKASDPSNKILGTAVLEGIPPMKAREPRIEIELKYNVDGIVELSATEKSTGKSINVRLEGTTKLDDYEIAELAAAERAN